MRTVNIRGLADSSIRAGPEEAVINWSGQEVGMALDNLWVWPMTIHGCIVK